MERMLKPVPLELNQKEIDEILYNINRKRYDENELSDHDVKEVLSNIHYNGPYVGLCEVGYRTTN